MKQKHIVERWSFFVFKPGVCIQLESTWFLEIAFIREVGMFACVCVCVCVCVFVSVHPRGYKLHSRDIEPLQPAEQVFYV